MTNLEKYIIRSKSKAYDEYLRYVYKPAIRLFISGYANCDMIKVESSVSSYLYWSKILDKYYDLHKKGYKQNEIARLLCLDTKFCSKYIAKNLEGS